MISVIGYTVHRCSFSQVWAPPWILFLLAIAIAYPPSSPPLGSLDLGGALLLPVATWLSLATLNSDPGSNQAAMAGLVGGLVRYRLAVVASALIATLALVPLSVGWAVLRGSTPLSAPELLVAVEDHAVSAVAGVVIGAMVARPLVTRRGFALMGALLLIVLLLAVPRLPPVRSMIELLESPSITGHQSAEAAVVTVTTLVGAALALWATSALARIRS
jgi:hypothetical protein